MCWWCRLDADPGSSHRWRHADATARATMLTDLGLSSASASGILRDGLSGAREEPVKGATRPLRQGRRSFGAKRVSGPRGRRVLCTAWRREACRRDCPMGSGPI